MNAITTVSAKGQIVIPKDVRDRLRLKTGDKLEIVEAGGRLTLRLLDVEPRISIDEAKRRFREIYQHKGPPVTIGEMKDAIDRALTERAERKGW